MPATRARQGVLPLERTCADYPSCSAQYQFVLPEFLGKCVGRHPGVLEVGRYLMVSWCHSSSCFYCLNFVPNAHMNVALGWKMHLAWSLISSLLPPWWKCQFFLLWWGTWSKPWIVSVMQTLTFSKIIPVPIPLADLVRYLLLACFPIPCSCQTPPRKKEKKKIFGTGLVFNGHHQCYVCAEVSPRGSDCNTAHCNNHFFLGFR